MPDEAYSARNEKIAVAITSAAHDAMLAAGLDPVEACHALAHAGIDYLRAYTCPSHLADEWACIVEALEDRLARLQPAASEVAH